MKEKVERERFDGRRVQRVNWRLEGRKRKRRRKRNDGERAKQKNESGGSDGKGKS
jgi:hypothetical protein